MDTRVQESLGLRRPPVAIGFFDAPPAGLQRWTGGPVPSRCTFWRCAMEGQSFYTTRDDHVRCAIGSYTHGADLPAERSHELHAAHGFSQPDPFLEVQHLPQLHVLDEIPEVIAYAPLPAADFAPTLIVVTATPAQAMQLHEAAVRASADAATGVVVTRPGCALMAMAGHRKTVCFSLGCRNNRKLTALGDDELYFCVPAALWAPLTARLGEVLAG